MRHNFITKVDAGIWDEKRTNIQGSRIFLTWDFELSVSEAGVDLLRVTPLKVTGIYKWLKLIPLGDDYDEVEREEVVHIDLLNDGWIVNADIDTDGNIMPLCVDIDYNRQVIDIT